jgi:hypothetical protein
MGAILNKLYCIIQNEEDETDQFYIRAEGHHLEVVCEPIKVKTIKENGQSCAGRVSSRDQ